MIRMSRVGVEFINNLADPDSFVRAVHVTGDLENLGQGTPDDKRYFVTVADERTILHFGSSYGGNALLGKIAHGLRQAAYDGWASGKFLGEQFMLLGITDKETGKKYHICGGFPSASGKTNLAMTLAPDALGDRYHVAVLRRRHRLAVGRARGRPALRDEPGVRRLRCRQGHQRGHQPDRAGLASAEGTQALFTNVAYNENTQEVWWEGRTKNPPADLTGWRDWKGKLIADRDPPTRPSDPWAHPNSRFTTTLANVPNVADGLREPGGRADRRDHLRWPYPRPRAADPRDHRPRRGRVRRSDAGRRGHIRRRGRRRVSCATTRCRCGRSCPTPRADMPRTG